MEKIHNDQPINGVDKSLDELNRTQFAKRVSEGLIISKESSSLVVSIEGKWGYGKTSVLNLIKTNLKKNKEDQPIVLDFNPWMIGNSSNLVQGPLLLDPQVNYKLLGKPFS
mgnify:CR=1 FL=1